MAGTKKSTTGTKKEMTAIDVPASDITVIPSQYDRLIESGFNSNADLERMERLFELKKAHEENEARKAYHSAMADFKKETIVLTKDKKNTQYDSMYTTIGNLINTVVPILGAHGLSHKWDISQSDNGMITVTCIATHSLGHSDSVPMVSPPDTSGKKNPIQQIKSTVTYLKAATFESLFGLASTDANVNDDGNGSVSVKYIDEKQLTQLTDMLLAIDKTEAEYLIHRKVAALKDIPASMFGVCVAELKPLEVD